MNFIQVLILLLVSGRAPAQPDRLVLDVDCDGGDDLESALEEVFYGEPANNSGNDRGRYAKERGPGLATCIPPSVLVNIRGTCDANVSVPRLQHVAFVGSDAESAGIRGRLTPEGRPVGPVIAAEDDSHVDVHNLTISRGVPGVRAQRAVVSVRDCRLLENETAVTSESSSFSISNSELAGNPGGLVITGGELGISDSTIANQFYGIFAQLYAIVTVGRTEIEGGVFARIGSYAWIYSSNVSGGLAVSVSENSQVQVSGGSIQGQVFAGLDSSLRLLSVEITGDLFASEFGKVVVSNSDVSGSIRCDGTSDASCSFSTVSGGSTCDNCRTPPPPSPSTPVP